MNIMSEDCDEEDNKHGIHGHSHGLTNEEQEEDEDDITIGSLVDDHRLLHDEVEQDEDEQNEEQEQEGDQEDNEEEDDDDDNQGHDHDLRSDLLHGQEHDTLRHEDRHNDGQDEEMGDPDGHEHGFGDGNHELDNANNELEDASSNTSISNHSNIKIVKVVPLPHARSEVWSFFGFIADDDGEIQDKKKAICKLCASTLAYSGNTTNLFTHLKAMHPQVQPQKLAPTNRTPRTGKKAGWAKRKADVMLESSMITTSNNRGHEGSSMISREHQTNHGQIHTYIHRGNLNGNQNANSRTVENNVEGKPNNISSPSLASSLSSSSATHHQINSSNNNLFELSQDNISLKNSSSSQAQLQSQSRLSSSSGHNLSLSSLPDDHTMIATSDITDCIVNWMVKDCRPLCVVEGKGFQTLLKLLAPGYVIPERRTMLSMVKKRYDQVRRDLILKAMQDE